MLVIVWRDPIDTFEALPCRITSPAYNNPNIRQGRTDLALCQWVAKQVLPAGVPYTIMDTTALPAFRDFRDAWSYDSITGRVSTDMAKAREIKRAQIRGVCDAERVKLNNPYTKAVASGDLVEQRRVATRQQELLDTPQTLPLATLTTPEELRAFWPLSLPLEAQP